jgi:probable O-glycosylation ligase (exosortase A-associated)
MRDLVFLMFFMIYLPMALRFPHIGAMIWAWLAFSAPGEYLFGFMNALPLSKIVAVLTVGALLVHRDGRKPYFDGIMVLLLAFLALGAVSASLAITALPLNWELFGKVVKITALCFVITSVVTTRRRLQGMILAIALGLAFNGADEGLKVLLTGGSHHVLGIQEYGDNNQFAVAMLMCMPLLLFLYNSSIHPVARAGFMGTLVLCGIAVIGTYSRGGFVGLVALALGLIALNRNKLRNLLAVAVFGFVLLQAAPSTWFNRIDTIETANKDDSFMGRVTSWKISTLIALDRPLIGGGFHAQQDTPVWQHYGKDLAAFDFVPSASLNKTGVAAHSIYFEVLGDLGFTGLFIFLSMLLTALRYCSMIRKRAAAHADLAWMVDLAGMMRLSLIVYMVSGAALSVAYFEGFFLLLALLSVTRRMLSVELAHRAGAVERATAAATAASHDAWLAPGMGQTI